jgi:hypothetical protein
VSFAGYVTNAFGVGTIAVCTELYHLTIGTAAGRNAAHKIAYVDGCNFCRGYMKRKGIVATGSKSLAEVYARMQRAKIFYTVYLAFKMHEAKLGFGNVRMVFCENCKIWLRFL